MLIVHNPNKSSSARGRIAYSEQIVNSLETYANLNELVNIHPLTALSPFATMHEDICSLAEDKEVGFIILPFHKLPTPDGKLEEEGSTSFRGVNLNVLAEAPCSVGIFVDRGFGVAGESNLTMRQIAMFFIGGPDDREALSYAWRMAMSHGIGLSVVRFIHRGETEEVETKQTMINGGRGTPSRILATPSIDKQTRLDNEFVTEFRLKSVGQQFMAYEEKLVNDDEDLISELKSMHHIYDLYVVGRSEGMNSPITVGLMDWCEYPELGAMGDLLVTSIFAQGSVLVVQQYAGYKEEEDDEEEEKGEDGGDMVESSIEGSRKQERENSSDWRLQAEDYDGRAVEMQPFAMHNNSKTCHGSVEMV